MKQDATGPRSAGILGALVLVVGAAPTPTLTADDEAHNNAVSLLAASKPAIGVWTSALSAPRIAKSLAP